MHYQREQYFSSFDEFNSFPHGWDADFSTTAVGSYDVALKQSVTPGFLVNTAWFGAPTLQQASSPKGMRTFAIPLHLPSPYCWRGLPVDARTLMTFPSDRELFSMMSANSEVMTISVDQELVDGCLHGWELDPDKVFQLPRITRLSESKCVEMRQTVATMTEFLVKYGDHRQAPQLSRAIQEFMIENMLQPIMDHLDEPRIAHSAAAKRVKKAADYILDRLCESVSVGDICKHIGCSSRSLEQSFKQYAGTSPKQFIRIMRLEQCRKTLLKARAGDQVKSIALQHGYWHMGQFSADYKALFGELPSQSLTRKK